MRLVSLLLAALAGFLPFSAGQAKDTGLRLASLDGRTWIKPGDDGRLTVIAFWDSGCPPCLVELQSLPALARANPSIRFIAAGLETRDVQARTLARVGLTANISGIELASATPGNIQRLGNPRGALPFSTAHASDGAICGRLIGALNSQTLPTNSEACGGNS
jgi:thiol-disulfide isomerase/thioredoxin